MMPLHELRRTYREAILAAAYRHKADDVRIVGSFARGEASKSSDIELLVRFQPDTSLLDESALALELNQLLAGKADKVDVVADDVLREEFKDRILGEAVPF